MSMDQHSPAFPLLCDLVASDRLLVVTGAGISLSLSNKFTGARIPSWLNLLRQLAAHVDGELTVEERVIVNDVLAPNEVASPILIEVASILRKASPDEFQRKLLEIVTPEENATSDAHRSIINIAPRGILTFNYDDAHENAADELDWKFRSMIPDDEDEIVELLKIGIRNNFILKAHGCVRRGDGELILDGTSYRNILARKPAYRAFVQALMTNFNCLFVGFGLSDPDFDLFINTIAAAYGSPLGPHIVIRHQSQRSADDFLLKRKYGIETLYVSDYPRIPEVILSASTKPGPILADTLSSCLNDDFDMRQRGHDELAQLGQSGAICAMNVLSEQLKTTTDEFVISEIAYSLGCLNAQGAKSVLIEIVENMTYRSSDPAARALTVLRGVLTQADIPQIKQWRDRYARSTYADDPQNRLMAYCEYLLGYIPAKFNSRRRAAP